MHLYTRIQIFSHSLTSVLHNNEHLNIYAAIMITRRNASDIQPFINDDQTLWASYSNSCIHFQSHSLLRVLLV